MIHEYENSLRRLIIDVIGGDDTSPYKVAEDKIAKWIERRDIESKKNHGTLLEKRLLYYSDFYDLGIIIDKNWDMFSPILNNKKRFDVFFSEVEKYRDNIAHGRDLTSGQEALLKGITADLKNLSTIYHNKNEMKDDYFIRILSVTDNLGNNFKDNLSIRPTLRVGDEYEIVIEANDPKDRSIEYRIYSLFPRYEMIQFSNRFNFNIPKGLTGKVISLVIKVSTPDSDYLNEDMAFANYTILPA